MAKENLEITDEIQAIRKDRKACEILGKWFQSAYKVIPEEIDKGDIVHIVYTVNKGFNNIVSIEKQSLETKQNVESNTIPQHSVSDSTLNCIIMQSVQYSKDKNIDLDKATEELIKSYKKIKQSI